MRGRSSGRSRTSPGETRLLAVSADVLSLHKRSTFRVELDHGGLGTSCSMRCGGKPCGDRDGAFGGRGRAKLASRAAASWRGFGGRHRAHLKARGERAVGRPAHKRRTVFSAERMLKETLRVYQRVALRRTWKLRDKTRARRQEREFFPVSCLLYYVHCGTPTHPRTARLRRGQSSTSGAAVIRTHTRASDQRRLRGQERTMPRVSPSAVVHGLSEMASTNATRCRGVRDPPNVDSGRRQD